MKSPTDQIPPTAAMLQIWDVTTFIWSCDVLFKSGFHAYRNRAYVQIACRIWRFRMLKEQNICAMTTQVLHWHSISGEDGNWAVLQSPHLPRTPQTSRVVSSISGPMPNLHSNPKTRWSEWMFRFAKHCFKRNHVSFTISWEVSQHAGTSVALVGKMSQDAGTSVALVVVRQNATHLYELDFGAILTLVCYLFCIWGDTFMEDIRMDIYGGAGTQLGLKVIDWIQPHCLTISYFVFALHYSHSKQNELPNVIKMCRV